MSVFIVALWVALWAPLGDGAQAFASQAAGNPGPILYIGDSISYGQFGTVIDSALRTIAPNVVSEASCGSSPANWLFQGQGYSKTVCGYWQRNEDGSHEREQDHNTPKLTEELGRIHPAVTVVQLGTNIAANPQSQSASVAKMMQTIRSSGSQCIWIGPPMGNDPAAGITSAKLRATSQMIQSEAAANGCQFVDTYDLTKNEPPGGDGIHPPASLAQTWANQVLQKLEPFVGNPPFGNPPGSKAAPAASTAAKPKVAPVPPPSRTASVSPGPVSIITSQACSADSLYLENSFARETDLAQCSDPGCKLGAADQFAGIRNLAQSAAGIAGDPGPASSSQGPLPWQCFAAAMALRPVGPGTNYANCGGSGASSSTSYSPPCVTAAYVTAVQSSFQQAMNCLGIDEREVFPLFASESSYQVNLWNSTGTGVGHLTASAIADVDLNRRFAPDIDKPQCKRFAGIFEQSGENYAKLSASNGKVPAVDPCQWIASSQNPAMNFLYAGAAYRQDRSIAQGLAGEIATGNDAERIATEIARSMYGADAGAVKNAFDLFVLRQDPKHQPMSYAQFDAAFGPFLRSQMPGDSASSVSALAQQINQMTESTACSD